MTGRVSAAALVLLGWSCVSYQVNLPLETIDKTAGYRYENLARPASNSGETFVVLTLSGGGTRAAALAYGALRHLNETHIGGRRTLLDEVDIISSVSGGSFAAAYYALVGDKEKFFHEFPDAVLYRKIQSALVWRVAAPWNWPRLLSPRFGRSDLLNIYYDKKIFKRGSYADLSRELPIAILNGTDMSLGAQFPFTQSDFDRLCSDLSKVKVSRAVISSSAFPGAFTPLTWRNYPDDSCGYEPLPWVDLAYGSDSDCLADPSCREGLILGSDPTCPAPPCRAALQPKLDRDCLADPACPRELVSQLAPDCFPNQPCKETVISRVEEFDICLGDPRCRGDLEHNPRRWDRSRIAKAYDELRDRPFIHVIDGGVADNIGLRGPTVALVTNDSSWSVLNRVNPTPGIEVDKIERVVVIVVDAKPRDRPKRDAKASPPGIISVLTAAASRPTANYSTDTVELLRSEFREWDDDAEDYEFQQPLCDEIAKDPCRVSSDPACVEKTVAKCRELFFLREEDRPPHPNLYRVHVRFDAIRDPALRREMQGVPTTLQLPRETVDELVRVAGTLLEQSAEFQRLKRDLQ